MRCATSLAFLAVLVATALGGSGCVAPCTHGILGGLESASHASPGPSDIVRLERTSVVGGDPSVAVVYAAVRLGDGALWEYVVPPDGRADGAPAIGLPLPRGIEGATVTASSAPGRDVLLEVTFPGERLPSRRCVLHGPDRGGANLAGRAGRAAQEATLVALLPVGVAGDVALNGLVVAGCVVVVPVILPFALSGHGFFGLPRC
jgi:hypothetical protein